MGNSASQQKNNQHDDNNNKSKPIEANFTVHVGIDFGTDGCALAFAYEDKIAVYEKWNTKKRKRSVKVKTQLLLNDKDEVMAFGDNANIIYSNLSGNEKMEWKFFDKFKMSLYEPDSSKKKTNDGRKSTNTASSFNVKSVLGMIPIVGGCATSHAQDYDDYQKSEQAKHDMQSKQSASCYLKAMNNTKSSPDIVFTEVFKRLKVIAMEYIKEHMGNKINSNEIQWIITVPAIWSENAKDKMKRWATKALLVKQSNCKIKDHILIVYEPDCAALAMFEEWKPDETKLMSEETQINDKVSIVNDPESLMLEIVHGLINDVVISRGSQHVQLEKLKRKDSNFNIGDKYILIDIGGGTLDVVCHKIVGYKAVQEIHYATGGKAGGCYVDQQYIKLLHDIFGKNLIVEFKQKNPNIYLEIIDNFQDAKAKFYRKKSKTVHSVDLPYEFIQYLGEELADNNVNSDVDAKISQFLKCADKFSF